MRQVSFVLQVRDRHTAHSTHHTARTHTPLCLFFVVNGFTMMSAGEEAGVGGSIRSRARGLEKEKTNNGRVSYELTDLRNSTY